MHLECVLALHRQITKVKVLFWLVCYCPFNHSTVRDKATGRRHWWGQLKQNHMLPSSLHACENVLRINDWKVSQIENEKCYIIYIAPAQNYAYFLVLYSVNNDWKWQNSNTCVDRFKSFLPLLVAVITNIFFIYIFLKTIHIHAVI